MLISILSSGGLIMNFDLKIWSVAIVIITIKLKFFTAFIEILNWPLDAYDTASSAYLLDNQLFETFQTNSCHSFNFKNEREIKYFNPIINVNAMIWNNNRENISLPKFPSSGRNYSGWELNWITNLKQKVKWVWQLFITLFPIF